MTALLAGLPLAFVLAMGNPDPQGLLIVANKQAASASLIDVASGRTLATLPTGTGPHEVAASRDGRWAVVTDYGAQTPGSSLTVLDLRRREVARTIDLVAYRRPHGVAFLPGDSLVAVTSEANQAVLVVNIVRGEVVRDIPTEQRGTHMVSVTADGRKGYTANIPDGTISEIDFATGAATRRLAVAPMTEGVAVSPDGRWVWVGSNSAHTVTVVDTRTWQSADTLPGSTTPYRVNISPDGRIAVVSHPMENVVRLYDGATRAELGTVSIPGPRGGDAGPLGSSISADSRYAYVALVEQDAVAVVDLREKRVLKYLETGSGPDGIAITAGGE